MSQAVYHHVSKRLCPGLHTGMFAVHPKRHNMIVALWMHGHESRTDVDELVFAFQIWILHPNLVENLMRQIVGHLHDAIFQRRGLASPMLSCVLELFATSRKRASYCGSAADTAAGTP